MGDSGDVEITDHVTSESDGRHEIDLESGDTSADDCDYGDYYDPGGYTSEEEEDEELAEVENLWQPIVGEDTGHAPGPFTAVPGPKNVGPANARPIDYVNLFFTPEFLQKIVDETNRYACQWVASHQQYLRDHPQSEVHQWIQQGGTSIAELRAFIGVAMNMGLVRKVNHVDAYLFDGEIHDSQDPSWFSEHFSQDRFNLLLKFLHFADSNKMPSDPQDPGYAMFKIQMLITHFQEKFLQYYHPHQDVCIDESMIGCTEEMRPYPRQFMSNKQHSFGTNLWCLSDSTNGYLCRFEVFKDTLKKPAARQALVMRLLQDSALLNLGHHLCLDDYFSSPALFKELHKERTTATGTVSKHRRDLPPQCTTALLKKGEVCEQRDGPLLCVAYQKTGRNKTVFLSTATTAGFEEIQRKGTTTLKPKCVVLYDKTMGGVDISDDQVYMYLAKLKTLKWTTKVALSLFGRAVVNSYIIYVMNTTDSPKLSLHHFMISVVESLAGDYYPSHPSSEPGHP